MCVSWLNKTIFNGCDSWRKAILSFCWDSVSGEKLSRYCHSIRSRFKFSNYRLINKRKKIAFQDHWRSVVRLSNDWKSFQVLIQLCSTRETEVFFMYFLAAHRPIFFLTSLVRINRKLKIHVGSAGKQLNVLETYFLRKRFKSRHDSMRM